MHRLVVVDGLLSQVIYQGASLYRLLSDINNVEFRQQNLPSSDPSSKSGFSNMYLTGSILDTNQVV